MLIKQTKSNQNVIGSSASGLVLHTKLKVLLNLFGKPTKIGSGDNKVQLEWQFIGNNDNSIVVTIYDYKEEKPLHRIEEWQIGSKNISQKEIIIFLKGKGFSELNIEIYRECK